jgi:hypothetical protein
LLSHPKYRLWLQRGILLPLFLFAAYSLMAQDPQIGKRLQNSLGGLRRAASGGTADTLRHRDRFEDSITISFRYLDSTGTYKLDSSIGDFTRRFPIPATHVFLGNTGTATRSILFTPNFSAGFDPGFHAFDVYEWKVENARFYNTTRPYSEISYLLGTRAEQIITLMHTQNIKATWNFGFQYRLINSPGFFQNQRTNHNNYQLTSRYQGKKLRYTAWLALVGNKMQANENGGIIDTTNILNDPIYKERFNINTYLGGSNPFSANFFSTKINTGEKYSEFTALFRHQYDVGKKDSIVTDSTVVPLFFPRIRFEHTIRLDQDKYRYTDLVADSAYYKRHYDTTLSQPTDTFALYERWEILSNDFSIYQFPDAKNLRQFIKLGIMLQHIAGDLSSGHKIFINTAGHAEYRNRSKNQLWDIEALGKLFFTGFNAGDYEAHISLERTLGKKIGAFRVGFENTSRSPSFFYDPRSSYYLLKTQVNFKKENNTHLYASYFLPLFHMQLTGHYYLLSNYTYITDYYKLQQESGLFNVLQVDLLKTFKITKHWVWHAEAYIQKLAGNGPVHVPLLYTRNRIAYEGNLGFKNLDIAMGAEVRYRSPYKADNYSPALGQWFFQDSLTIRNATPDISAYVHFRIKSFKAYVRAENLNTARNLNGFSFTRNNLLAPGYPLPGLQIRVGIYWGFVN